MSETLPPTHENPNQAPPGQRDPLGQIEKSLQDRYRLFLGDDVVKPGDKVTNFQLEGEPGKSRITVVDRDGKQWTREIDTPPPQIVSLLAESLAEATPEPPEEHVAFGEFDATPNTADAGKILEHAAPDAILDKRLAKLHRDKQGGEHMGTKRQRYKEAQAAWTHRLTLSPAEILLTANKPLNTMDVAFLQAAGLWEPNKKLWRDPAYLVRVNEALKEAKDIHTDESSSEGITTYGNEMARLWDKTHWHGEKPPSPKRLNPLP